MLESPGAAFVALAAISSSYCRDGAVVDYPQIESRQHTDDYADDHVCIRGTGHGGEAEKPGGKDCPNAKSEVHPLLPLSERKQSAECNERNCCADDQGIPSRCHLTREAERPRSERQANAKHGVHEVNGIFCGFACPKHVLSPWASERPLDFADPHKWLSALWIWVGISTCQGERDAATPFVCACF